MCVWRLHLRATLQVEDPRLHCNSRTLFQPFCNQGNTVLGEIWKHECFSFQIVQIYIFGKNVVVFFHCCMGLLTLSVFSIGHFFESHPCEWFMYIKFKSIGFIDYINDVGLGKEVGLWIMICLHDKFQHCNSKEILVGSKQMWFLMSTVFSQKFHCRLVWMTKGDGAVSQFWLFSDWHFQKYAAQV